MRLCLFRREMIAASDLSLRYADCLVSANDKVTQYGNVDIGAFKDNNVSKTSLPPMIKMSKAHVVLILGEAPDKRSFDDHSRGNRLSPFEAGAY